MLIRVKIHQLEVLLLYRHIYSIYSWLSQRRWSFRPTGSTRCMSHWRVTCFHFFCLFFDFAAPFCWLLGTVFLEEEKNTGLWEKENTVLSVQMCVPAPLWTEDTSSTPTGELWLASLDEVWPLPPPHCQISQPRHLQTKTNPLVMFVNTKLFFYPQIIISRCSF